METFTAFQYKHCAFSVLRKIVNKENWVMSPGPVYLPEYNLIVYEKTVKFMIEHYFPSNVNPKWECEQLGQVNSHQTGNTSSQMHAVAHGNINYINYYGSNSANAWNPSQQSMDPEKFTRPLADVATATMGPALKSPTVEECGYSDRIQQITTGNSTITTQEAAQAVVAYGKWPEYYEAAAEAIDLPTKPGVSCDRFFTLDSVSWTKTTKAFVFNLPGCLSDLGVFGQNLLYHYLYRSGFCVHVQCNASKFHQGMFIAALIPEFQTPTMPKSSAYEITDWNQWPAEWPIGQLTLAPHQLVNLRTNNAATIIYPFTSPVPACFGPSHDFVSLIIMPIVPLDYSAGASTNIPITISIAPMCSQFSGLRQSLATQGVPTFEIPGSRQFSSVLRNSGFPLYPEFEETHGFENPGQCVNLLEVAQVGTFIDFKQTGNGYVYTVDVTNQQTSAPIFSWDLSFLSGPFVTTYIGKLARMFNTYRGSLVVEFCFCGSAMATGKILISYVPPGGDPPRSRKEAMLGTHVIWDLGLQSTCKFSIPYISTSQFRYNAIDSNILSLDGYICAFYQTAIVVPPGAPSTCQLVAKLSAADNFCMRIPSDDAYFQGIGDKIQEVVQGSLNTAIQSTNLPAVTSGLPSGLSIQAGDGAALTSSETGATASSDGAGNMEVRQSDITFSSSSTDIEFFFSRYYFVKQVAVNNTDDLKYLVIGHLPTMIDGNTSLKTKFKMFTYWKYDLDVVIVVARGPNNQGNRLVAQALFVPYGNSLPANSSSALWNTTANPLITFKEDDPPVSLRIPFLTSASAFASSYNGYSKFGQHLEADYGFFPGSYFGTLFFRTLSATTNLNWYFNVFVRPVNIKVWIPRPIQTYKPSSRLQIASTSTNRARFVDGDPDLEYFPLGLGDCRTYSPYENCEASITNPVGPFEEYLYHCCYPVYTQNGPFTMFCLKGDYFILPLHAYNCPGVEWRITVYTKCSPYYDWTKEHIEQWKPSEKYEFKNIDVVVLKFDGKNRQGIYRYLPYTSPDLLPFQNIFICSPEFENCHGSTQTFCQMVPSYRVPGGVQGPAYSTNYAAKHGHCGGIIYDGNLIYGMLVAGIPAKRIGLFSPLTKNMLSSVPSFEAPVLKATPLGPLNWFKQYARECGTEMGEGFTANIDDKVSGVIKQIQDAIGHTFSYTATNQIVKVIVKFVSSFIILLNSSNKAETLIALTAMLGVDLMTCDPFDWLQGKILNYFGKNVQPQGPSEWIKEFNAACTALKGLDWFVEKLMKFFDWLKSFVKKEEPLRKRFLMLIEQWPEIMIQFDECDANGSALSDKDKIRLCERIIMIKELADKYGIERNFATTQVVKYYIRAQKMLKNIRDARHEPVALCIHGGPGQGKSVATEMIGRAISRVYDGQMPYSLPPDPKHFDGYKQQDVVLMDDVGQNPDGMDLALFCQMVSTTQFIPPMASLEEKGQAFTSKFVLCSTNNESLKPPTIAEPKALQRRFFLDLDVELDKNYRINNKLDLVKATEKCEDCAKPAYFNFCSPLVCGKAILFKDRNTKVSYSIDDIVTKMIDEQKRRARCLNLIDSFFQGNVDPEEWLMSDWDKEQQEVIEKETPPVLVSLLKDIPDERIINWCIQNGYVIPINTLAVLERKKIFKFKDLWLSLFSALTCVVSISSLIVLLVKLCCKFQGPYNGNKKEVLRKPELRQIEVQGPDVEFINKLFKSNLLSVVTSKGPYTALAIRDNIIVLPVHSGVGSTIMVNNVNYNVLDSYEMMTKHGSTELCVVELDRQEKYRDITKYLVECSTQEKGCWLAMDSELYPRLLFPVGTASPYGNINLSGKSVVSVLTYQYPTKTGQCGGVVCKAGKIIGMHIGGDGLNGYCALLKRSYFCQQQGVIVSKEKAPKPIHVSARTSLQPSVFYDVFEGTKEPAALSPNDKRLEVPLEEGLFSKYKGNCYDVPEELNLAVEHYVSQLKPLMPVNVSEPLPLEDVVYGIDGLEGLDLNTSAGFPYNTMGIKKKDLIPERGEPLTDLVKALDLHGFDLPFTTYLKDELRPKEKIKLGKTRLIEASSLNDTIRMKMQYGRLFQVFHKNPGMVTGSAVGCNPDEHWTKFLNELGEENIIAFDYSNFDASLSPFWFDGLKLVLEKLGLDSSLINKVCNSKHIYKNVIYEVEGGMPSGCSGTSVFNSIINNLIIRLLAVRTYKYIDLDKLRIIAYGDDVLCSYPFPLDPGVLAAEGKKFGLTMTPADKASDFDGVKSIYEVTFLKRKFVRDNDYPFLVHPVFPMSEISESIRWTRSPKCTQEHVRSLCELAWHAGRASYEDFLEKVRSVPVGRALALPSYDYLYRRWLDLF